MRLQTSITSGLVIPKPLGLPIVLAPLACELTKCYWLMDTQSGPFRDHYLREMEAVYDELFVEVDPCRNTSCTCWRPGTLPRHADHVVIDEWTYLFAMRCDAPTVSERVAWLWRRSGKFDAEFFAGLSAVADLFVMHVDEWWEVYTPHDDWQRELRSTFPESFIRSAGEVGRPPGEAA